MWLLSVAINNIIIVVLELSLIGSYIHVCCGYASTYVHDNIFILTFHVHVCMQCSLQCIFLHYGLTGSELHMYVGINSYPVVGQTLD